MLLGFLADAKKGGVLVLGHGVVGAGDDENCADTLAHASNSRDELLHSVIKSGVKAFPHVALGRNMRIACQNLVLTAGFAGALEPELIAIPLSANIADVEQRTELAVSSSSVHWHARTRAPVPSQFLPWCVFWLANLACAERSAPHTGPRGRTWCRTR